MNQVACQVAGQWVDHWPPLDRSVQYGDGLFETIRLDCKGNIPLWRLHAHRLQTGIERLSFPENTLYLIEQSWLSLARRPATAVKLLLSRGESVRGYAMPDPARVNIQWQFFVAPDWRWPVLAEGLLVGVNPVRLASQPLLAGIKHLNRLEQVLARAKFAPQWHESIMLDNNGCMVEGCMSNLFWFADGLCYTPPVDQAGVRGVVRSWLEEKFALVEKRMAPESLFETDLVFMSNCLMGLVPVNRIDGLPAPSDRKALDSLRVLQTELEACF